MSSAITPSATSFGGKIAGGLGAAMIGWILALTGYDQMGDVLTAPVRYGIYTICIYLPLVLLVVMFVLSGRFDIEAKYADIMNAINTRKESK